MSLRWLAIKYASNDMMQAIGPISGDNSLGSFINQDKVIVLKSKLMEAYDKLTEGITNLPLFIDINEQLKENPYLEKFNELIENYTDYVLSHDLKECFTFSIRLIENLNQLRDDIRGRPQKEIYLLENAIKSIQDHIWKESKRILNLHDLKGLTLNFPEDIHRSVKDIVPTWDFGPGKSPAYKQTKSRKYETPSSLMKRLMKENEQEEKIKKEKQK